METQEDLRAELERLKAENEQLKSKSDASRQVYLKVSEKGGISLYGLGRFPVTLYQEQWDTVLGMTDQIREFIATNRSRLKAKPER
jgi:hypothetical protein